MTSTIQSIKGYQLTEMLGQGPFSVVQRAIQPGLNREVAVKIIVPDYANNLDFIRRFEVEYRHVARLEHPHIVPLYDYWRDPDGAYLVMPYFPANLSTVSPLPLAKVVTLAEQIADALALAHYHGIIHHNLKPSNILLDENQNAYLTDFNILLAPDETSPQVDIADLGRVLHWALTGTSYAAQQQQPYSAPLAKVIERALANHPHDRFPDAISLAEAFHAAAETSDSPEIVTRTALDHFIKGSGGIRWRFEQQVQNPFKGLYPFEESDADNFFGRAVLTQRIIDRLAENEPWSRFLAIVGPSGSGKSSVVKAGVVAALRRGALPGSEQWFIVEMTPKTHPLQELQAALLKVAVHDPDNILAQLQQNTHGLAQAVNAALPANSELVLIIDQFEELFTLNEDPQRVAHFLEMLLDAVSVPANRVRILITLRADFYDRPLMHPTFSAMVSQRTEVVVPLTPEELAQAITAPLERIGIGIEAGLVQTIVAEIKEQPGTLPMLQYALTELFDRRDDYTITTQAYRDIGGILGALTKHADETYQGLTAEQQAVARQLFLRLIALGEGTEDTRRQVLRAELLSLYGEWMATVIETFGAARLLTFDRDSITRGPTVEVAHEAIIREWTRLRNWLADSRDDLRQQRQLAIAAGEWLQAGEDASFLVGGSRLDQLEAWMQTTDLALTGDETRFIQACLTERNRRLAAEANRQAHEKALERRARHILRALAAVSVLAAIIGFILAVLALDQRGEAIDARHASDTNAAISHEIALLSNSQLALYRDDDTDLAIALALEAIEQGNLIDQEIRVLTETMYAPSTRRVYTGHTGGILSADLSQDGTQILSGGNDAIIRLWDVATGEILHQFEGHTAPVHKVVFSPDEQLFASAAEDATVRLWDVASGDVVHVLPGDMGFLWVAFHPNGQLLATASQNQLVQIWDVATGEVVQTLGPDDPDTEEVEGHSNYVTVVTFSPDGEHLLSGGQDNIIIHWDWQTETVTRTYDMGGYIYSINFSPDGKTFFSSAQPKDLHQWDLATGQETIGFKAHTAAVHDIAFSPDGITALTASQDQTVRLWDLTTGAERHRFVGHSDTVHALALLPNNQQFITASEDGTLRLWDLATDQMVYRVRGHENSIYQVKFNADGTHLLSTSRDLTLRLWDAETGELIRTFGPDDPATEAIEGHADRVMSADFSPAEKTILSGDFSSNIILWDAETGEILRIFGPDNLDTPDVIEGHTPTTDPAAGFLSLWYVTFAPDGKTAFSSAFDKTIIRWNLETGEVIHRYEGHTDGVLGVTLVDGGRRFLSHSWDKSIILWDTESGAIIRRFEGHTNWIWSAALSPDETTFLSASADKTMILWEIETGRALRHFLGHDDAVLSVDFSPDGQWAVSSGRDNLVKLWNVQTGEWVRHYGGHNTWVRSIDYSPVSNIFVTGDNDGNIFLWKRRSLAEMVQWTQANRYVRELSCGERDLYRVEPYCEQPTDIQ